jgi:hypothetical protein
MKNRVAEAVGQRSNISKKPLLVLLIITCLYPCLDDIKLQKYF